MADQCWGRVNTSQRNQCQENEQIADFDRRVAIHRTAFFKNKNTNTKYISLAENMHCMKFFFMLKQENFIRI